MRRFSSGYFVPAVLVLAVALSSVFGLVLEDKAASDRSAKAGLVQRAYEEGVQTGRQQVAAVMCAGMKKCEQDQLEAVRRLKDVMQ